MARSIATSSTGQHLVEQRAGDGEAASCRCRARRCPRRWCRRPPSPARRRAAGASPGSSSVSTPITLMSGFSPRAATAQPAIRPPPPTGTTSVSSSRHVLQHLQRDRALARDDARIVVGMDEDELARRRPGDAPRWPASASVSPCSTTARAVPARVLDLGVGREGRHDDGGRDAEPAGVIGHALGVVAGRHGDDAALALLVA